MKVVIAPDGFGGTLSASEAAAAIAEGWRRERPDDELVEIPLSDGGEGLLEVVAQDDDRWMTTEVAGPLGRPVDAPWLLRDGHTAIIESARACGLALVPEELRTPLRTTTYGVGQLVEAARSAGATRILVGLGGSATVDGGAGALSGLGFRLTVDDGSGLKIGADDLHRVVAAEPGWGPDFDGIDVRLLSDVTTTLDRSAEVFGPQKGATPEQVDELTHALLHWADVAERDLAGGTRHRDTPGSGAAGGLGFALACGLGARYEPGAERIATLAGFDEAVSIADVVITGEGRLDQTSLAGKVIGVVRERCRSVGRPLLGVVGQVGEGGPILDDLEVAAPDGPGPDPAHEVSAAAQRLAGRR
ncbi:MAG: glycerate kinase [Intrasporangiaceae bacterium]|nr:glycerate kinase [Intrasporangiaceae bacterium]